MTLNDQIDAAGLRARIGDEDFLYPSNQPGVTVCVLWLLGGENCTGMFGPDASVSAIEARARARDAAYQQLLDMKKAEDKLRAESLAARRTA